MRWNNSADWWELAYKHRFAMYCVVKRTNSYEAFIGRIDTTQRFKTLEEAQAVVEAAYALKGEA